MQSVRPQSRAVCFLVEFLLTFKSDSFIVAFFTDFYCCVILNCICSVFSGKSIWRTEKFSDEVLAWLSVLERGADDLHMVQRMPYLCFRKI